MKIRITGAGAPTYWYADKIGDEIEVVDKGRVPCGGSIQVKHYDPTDEEGVVYFVFDGDYEIVKYREVKREANVGDRIKIVAAGGAFGMYANGDEFIVNKTDDEGVYVPDVATDSAYKNPDGFITHREYVVLESISAKVPAKPDALAALTERVEALESEIAALKKGPNASAAEAEAVRRLATKVSERVTQALANPAQTAAQIAQIERDRIVEDAKADVADPHQFAGTNIPGEILKFWPKGSGTVTHVVEYVVNRDKRTVVALVIKTYGLRSVVARGIAKCAPDDVFNVHIGKVIALYRALGLNVPAKYLNVPKPTEIRVGDVVKGTTDPQLYTVSSEYVGDRDKLTLGYVRDPHRDIKIIDDSREGTEVAA